MEFSEVTVKDSPGVCRCCLSEGCYKDLGTEYTWMNETEVYADMLLDCFDIGISQHHEGPNGPMRLICEVCITRLRDACNFKKQILETEKKFIDMLARGEFRPKVLVYQNVSDMKSEAVEEMAVNDVETTEVEYLEDLDYVPDEPVKFEEELEVSKPSSSEVKKKGRPKKSAVEQPERKRKTKDGTSKGGPLYGKDETKLSSTMQNRRLKHNAITILQSSNVIPFKWLRHSYLCFYCHFTQKTIELLKEHTLKSHPNPNIKSAVSFLRRDEKVKIDVTDLQCRICGLKMGNIDALINHLVNSHDKKFFNGGNGIVQYKMSSEAYKCGVCDQSFQSFLKLNEHMNCHYNQYICDVCGKGFLSSDRLRCHSIMHTTTHKCTQCDQNFSTVKEKKQHETLEHNKHVLKCEFCMATFKDYTARKLHHSTAHGVSFTEFKCPICEKKFMKMSRMNKHLKEVHIKERNFLCSYCDMKFFTSTKLNEHMIKHTGIKMFGCDICNKKFARKQTMKMHILRVHSEKEIGCSECDMFTKDCVKRHLKRHQGVELNVD